MLWWKETPESGGLKWWLSRNYQLHQAKFLRQTDSEKLPPRIGFFRMQKQNFLNRPCHRHQVAPLWIILIQKCLHKVLTQIFQRFVRQIFTLYTLTSYLIFKEYFSPKKNSYQRSINAYYRHIERINLERTQSLSNLSKPPKSGKPSMLKPLKLWKPTQGKEKMMWVYGNPFSETDPKYLRTGSGQMTRLEEKTSGKMCILGKKWFFNLIVQAIVMLTVTNLQTLTH